ncbi:hypothetical protein [Alcaligenes sp. Marseille-Q7550]
MADLEQASIGENAERTDILLRFSASSPMPHQFKSGIAYANADLQSA